MSGGELAFKLVVDREEGEKEESRGKLKHFYSFRAGIISISVITSHFYDHIGRLSLY